MLKNTGLSVVSTRKLDILLVKIQAEMPENSTKTEIFGQKPSVFTHYLANLAVNGGFTT